MQENASKHTEKKKKYNKKKEHANIFPTPRFTLSQSNLLHLLINGDTLYNPCGPEKTMFY